VARRWKQHLNENAKNQAYFEEIPEMNHNALVGLEFPEELGKKVFFIILESKYDLDRNKLRENIVGQILQQRKVSFENVSIDPTGSKLAEMYQMILFGDFVGFYLAILNNVNPEPVKIIEFLKDRLAKKD
jgi:glucose/mannose-6-phosphate isomerase